MLSMGMRILRGLRLWNIFLSLAIALTYVGFLACLFEDETYTPIPWRDVCTLCLSGILFFVYIYSVRGKSFLNKYLRAFLMLGIIGFLLYLNAYYIALQVRQFALDSVEYEWVNGKPDTEEAPFDCSVIFEYFESYSGTWYAAYSKITPARVCLLRWTTVFMVVAAGPFMVVEALLALKTGPLRKPDDKARYGSHGYRDESNVVIVSPDQPHQPYQPYQPQQHGVFITDNNQQQQYITTVNASHELNYYGYPQHHQSFASPGHKTEELGHLVTPQGSQLQQQQHPVASTVSWPAYTTSTH
ncbi:hypothetical protein BGX26_009583 [Mortierella sp. AD094]|nr:hypothetical protein BGX26_009583 [Mortierella sp. AD094]